MAFGYIGSRPNPRPDSPPVHSVCGDLVGDDDVTCTAHAASQSVLLLVHKKRICTLDPATFFTELKRRKVYRVAVAYAIVAWLLIQAASILFPTFEAPPWVMKVFVTAVILGFPVALILAWAFELTPEGIKRAEEITT